MQSERQAIGMRQVLGEGDRLPAPRQGLLCIAEEPQGPRYTRKACDPGITAMAESQNAALLGIIEGHPLF